jgi:glucose/arabinose dehydrogenase
VALTVGIMVLVFVVVAVFLRGGGEAPSQPTTPTGSDTTTTPDGGTSTTIAGSTTTTVAGPLPEVPPLAVELIVEGLGSLTDLTAPVGDDRLFVVRRVGIIRLVDADGELVATPFLDLRDRVIDGGIEQGLLGMAFHPRYQANGRFFLYYINKTGHRRLSEFSVLAGDPNRGDPDSERVLFEYARPENSSEPRHYAGQVVFGPDGYLWVSSGDGAAARDQGQNPNTIFGTILRIDVDSGQQPFGIPPDNPFVAGGGRPEVWAYGLRNPWRIAHDPVERLLYIADVGQATWEEINVVPIDEGGGYNFGWAHMEGPECYRFLPDCDHDDYTLPVIAYPREDGWSITGGKVYRGSEIPGLAGAYFYSDWVFQWIRSFRYVDGAVVDEEDWTTRIAGWTTDRTSQAGSINAFGTDGHGELYMVTHGGSVYKLVPRR